MITRLAPFVFAVAALMAGLLFYKKLNEADPLNTLPAFALPVLQGFDNAATRAHGEVMQDVLESIPHNPEVLSEPVVGVRGKAEPRSVRAYVSSDNAATRTHSEVMQGFLDNGDLPTTPHVINFWASWCVSCLEEHPLLMQMQRAGLVVIGVNFQDRAEAARAWLEQHGNPYTTVVRDENGFFARTPLAISYLPQTLFVSGDGTIVKRVAGTLKPAHLKELAASHPALFPQVGAVAE